MALYLGSGEKLRVSLGSTPCLLHLVSVPPDTSGVRLLSSDGFVLRDSYGLYLVPKDSLIISENRLLSADDYMLKDANNAWLFVKEV